MEKTQKIFRRTERWGCGRGEQWFKTPVIHIDFTMYPENCHILGIYKMIK